MITIHDTIAAMLAESVGFISYAQSLRSETVSRYRWETNKKGHTAPYTPEGPDGIGSTHNPCFEIPLDYTLAVEINGSTISIHNRKFNFDLNDPLLITKLQEEFKDLDKLREKLNAFRIDAGFHKKYKNPFT